MRGDVRENRNGPGLRHEPPRRYVSPEVRINGEERDSGRVPQRGGNKGDWIDVRPRRRKVLRQDQLGQVRYQEGQ